MLKENLRILRNLNGYSQEQIAEKIEISRQAYAKWENGQTTPDLEKAARLAEVYGVTIDSLLKTETLEGVGTVPPAPAGKNIWGSVTLGDRGRHPEGGPGPSGAAGRRPAHRGQRRTRGRSHPRGLFRGKDAGPHGTSVLGPRGMRRPVTITNKKSELFRARFCFCGSVTPACLRWRCRSGTCSRCRARGGR